MFHSSAVQNREVKIFLKKRKKCFNIVMHKVVHVFTLSFQESYKYGPTDGNEIQKVKGTF